MNKERMLIYIEQTESACERHVNMRDSRSPALRPYGYVAGQGLLKDLVDFVGNTINPAIDHPLETHVSFIFS